MLARGRNHSPQGRELICHFAARTRLQIPLLSLMSVMGGPYAKRYMQHRFMYSILLLRAGDCAYITTGLQMESTGREETGHASPPTLSFTSEQALGVS
jgi:hypothetical protein